jgi:hypothetical protein
MSHPADMSTWESIGCIRGHSHHETLEGSIRVGIHGYHDYPLIPERFERMIDIEVWDWDQYRDGVGYCPANDVVSETIWNLRIWEPIETTLVLSALTGNPGVFMDMGAQLGWFSALAASTGAEVWAYEADPDVVEVLERNVPSATVIPARIGDKDLDGQIIPIPLPEGRVVLIKLDLEGDEPDAVAMLVPKLARGEIDHILMEVSPVFHDRYPGLVSGLVQCGFEAYTLPDKQTPPVRFVDFPADLVAGGVALHELPDAELRDLVGSWHQANVWFCRPGVMWG